MGKLNAEFSPLRPFSPTRQDELGKTGEVMSERQNILKAISQLESQRSVLGDAVADASIDREVRSGPRSNQTEYRPAETVVPG